MRAPITPDVLFHMYSVQWCKHCIILVRVVCLSSQGVANTARVCSPPLKRLRRQFSKRLLVSHCPNILGENKALLKKWHSNKEWRERVILKERKKKSYAIRSSFFCFLFLFSILNLKPCRNTGFANSIVKCSFRTDC